VEAWIGLLGAIAGAAIAFVGQHVSARSAERERRHTLLLEQASELAALEEDFRNRVWEERQGFTANPVTGWEFRRSRLAGAKLLLLSSSPRLATAMSEMREAGVELAREWRLRQVWDDDTKRAWEQHRTAIEEFLVACREVLRLDDAW
jgi:hypothetical protein